MSPCSSSLRCGECVAGTPPAVCSQQRPARCCTVAAKGRIAGTEAVDTERAQASPRTMTSAANNIEARSAVHGAAPAWNQNYATCGSDRWPPSSSATSSGSAATSARKLSAAWTHLDVCGECTCGCAAPASAHAAAGSSVASAARRDTARLRHGGKRAQLDARARAAASVAVGEACCATGSDASPPPR